MNNYLYSLHIPEANHFIDGRWVSPTSNQRDTVYNPMDESEIGVVAVATPQDVEQALSAARKAQPSWARRTAAQRATLVFDYAKAILAHADELAQLLTLEQGKPIREARAEIAFAVEFLNHAAESARHLPGEILPGDAADEQIWIQRVPYGVVSAMTAWNFPVALFTRKVGPALVTGNTIVVKPHEITPLTSLALAALASKAGIPAGVMNVVTGHGPVAGQQLVASAQSDLVSMTGSVRAGREIYAAGSRDIKSIRLELGGKAPFIVLADADIGQAVDAAVVSKFFNGGQVCTANDRMYVASEVYDEFTEKFLRKVAALRVGDPFSDVDIGPRVSGQEVAKLNRILEKALGEGAKELLNANRGARSDGLFALGYWFHPVVLGVESNNAAIMREETFGPILPIMKVDSFDDAIRFANEADYGLSAYLFTKNNRNIMRCIAELNFGEIFINRGAGESVQAFHSGYKLSGIGGEDGRHGIEGYMRKKTMYNHFSK